MSDIINTPQTQPKNFKDVKYVKAAGVLSIVGGVFSAIFALVMLQGEISEIGLLGLAYLFDIGVAVAYVALGWFILKAQSVKRLVSVLRTLAAVMIIHLLVVIVGGILITGELTAPGLIFIGVLLCISLAFRNLHQAHLTTDPAPFKARAVHGD